MNLLKDKEAFKEIITGTAQNKGITSEIIVEKDYVVSVVLKKLSEIEGIEIVFKGGTSLSKCYKVIDRFSEDIDIAIIDNVYPIPKSKRRKLKEEIIKVINDLGFTLLNEENIKSRWDFNQYQISYNNISDNIEAVNSNILIETIVSYEPFPCETKEITNYVHDFLVEIEEKDIIEAYNLSTFSMKVQRIDRTFIDKLFAICDYHIEKNYDRNSRHLYDIHKIYQSGLLDKIYLKELVEKVSKERQLNGKRNHSCEPGENPYDYLNEIIDTDSYKSDFLSKTNELLFEEVSYEECIDTLREIIDQEFLIDNIPNFREFEIGK